MPGRLTQVGHDRPGGVADAALLGHELAELEQLEPETEPAVRALEQAAADQLAGQPVRGALRQPGPPGQLRQGQRVAVELLKLRELSLKEAAQVSGMSISALKVSVHRAIKSLRVSLNA